jgi:ABC-type transport system involved in cytochrome c biogenesis permease subunit
MRSKPATWLLHLALTTIVVGACVTHFFGEQGEIHLRADKAQTLTHQSPITNHQSSVSLFLWDFQVVNDKDGNPVDFISELRLLDRTKNKEQGLVVDEGTVRMNKPLKYHGYRFCQSDYDSDLMGVVLAYNYDPWGIGITYTGYALLLIAMIAFFFQKHSYFRALLKKQHTWLMVGLGIAAVVLAFIMTKVVTPKPPLQPVLQTPLLGIHVSVIMLAYTLFAAIMVNGIIGLIMASKREQLMHLSQLLLYPALFCLTAGIFIGAVWANMSWGRYWGWDPKETWALITMLVYALLLHFPWLKKFSIFNFQFSIVYHVFSVINFLLVLFTYFGVSYLLGGLHSYA